MNLSLEELIDPPVRMFVKDAGLCFMATETFRDCADVPGFHTGQWNGVHQRIPSAYCLALNFGHLFPGLKNGGSASYSTDSTQENHPASTHS